MNRRGLLASALMGVEPDFRIWEGPVEAWQALAHAEGITALIADRLGSCVNVPGPLRDVFDAGARGLAALDLARSARLRSVLAALAHADTPALVLKGTALGQWLYPAPYLRESSDVDLLFASREDALCAVGALKPLGYHAPSQPSRFRHELLCRSADGKLDLDLHWALSDWPVLNQLPNFADMHRQGVALPGLGPDARALDAQHSLLHACVHRASNIAAGLGDRLKWLYDMHLLVGVLTRDDEWVQWVETVQRARVCGICAEGLAASMALFDTAVPVEVSQALQSGRALEPLNAYRLADWPYIQHLNFRALSARDRIIWLWERLLPPVAHLRELYGHEHGYAGLLLQRLKHLLARLSRLKCD